MAKKKKFKVKYGMLISIAAVALAIAAIFMMFAPAAVSKNLKIVYTGLQLTFGYTEKSEIFGSEIGAEIFKFSFMNFLPYLLLLAGIVLGVLSALGKSGKIFDFVSAGCMLAGGILFFCVIPMSIPAVSSDKIAETTKNSLTLGVGAIVAGVLSILAAAASLVKVFLKIK